MCPLDAVDGILNDLGICNIHAPVVIQVVHLAVAVVVDEDVVGVPVHVAAQSCASAGVSPASVVLRGPESAQDPHPVGIDAVLLEILKDQLVLVDHFHVDDDVFRPNTLLVVRKKILELEVLG